MSRWKKWALGLGATVFAVGTAFQFQRLTTEGPSYEVLKNIGDIEIRQYDKRIIARTPMIQTEDGKNDSFRILAGYIFGGNKGETSISMTTPVTTEASEPKEGKSISMTSPVETTQGEEGKYMTFTMPSEFTMETLPEPNDKRVEILQAPGRRIAALRFSGSAKDKEVVAKKKALLAAVKSAGLQSQGEPFLAQYDPPFVLGFLRRNEVSVEVK